MPNLDIQDTPIHNYLNKPLTDNHHTHKDTRSHKATKPVTLVLHKSMLLMVRHRVETRVMGVMANNLPNTRTV